MPYPRFETLGIAPDFLLIGRSAIDNLVARGFLEKEARVLTPEQRRAYDRMQRHGGAERRRKIAGRKVG